MATAKKSVGVEDEKSLIASLLAPPTELEYIPTGDIGFDMVLSNGRGLPMGSSILLWAEPGVGKSTLFTDAAKRLIQSHKAMNKPFKVLYVDIEGGAKNLIRDMDMNKYIESQDLLYYGKVITWRNMGKICDTILSGDKVFGDVKLIVIDSVGQIQSDQNMKNSIADGDFGTKSKERGNFYSKYLPMLQAKGISTFLVAQARQNQEAAGMYDPKTKAAASWSDRHNVDIIIKCSAKQDSTFAAKVEVDSCFDTTVKEANSYIMVMDPTAAGCKSREGGTHKTEVLIEKGKGVNNFYILFKMLKFHGYISIAGAWYSFDKALLELLGLKDKKYKKQELIDILSASENVGKLVGFMKEMNCFSTVKTTVVEDSDEDEVTEAPSEDNEVPFEED